jgi:hypothetical protein
MTLGAQAPLPRTEGFDPELPFNVGPMNGREAQQSGLRLKALVALCGTVVVEHKATYGLFVEDAVCGDAVGSP